MFFEIVFMMRPAFHCTARALAKLFLQDKKHDSRVRLPVKGKTKDNQEAKCGTRI
ncbi:hypothetical protein ALO83_104004 [Pseudomonas cannabina pv. alisalensis]|uniref:Uncharacterized protein n=1 Tax=Pseudomonas cannabina TaxID=86840 RepID=A0A0P9LBI0_PSECA|nr:Uncharacterized protein AC507_5207 [Pseudomonas syringae pv. maculicola]KPW24256.1 hypothetical protein ALO83_104004 [Pseudomonas cannabina pv. alisalensis]KPW66751.1 hypothetical protein ALO81_102409 [Pseudomonas cannabina]RMN79293.1 hypothetical protein ALQ53_103738 [Pseudomonas cannabina]RMN92235.1 hypothetical protein ALQ51_102333 [Pseudomonas cannabina]